MNSVVIDEVTTFLTPASSKTMHSIQILHPFDATHPIIIHLKLNRVTIFFNVRNQTQEEYEDWDFLKIDFMVEAPSWDASIPEINTQEQIMFHNRGWFVSPNTAAKRQLFIDSIT